MSTLPSISDLLERESIVACTPYKGRQFFEKCGSRLDHALHLTCTPFEISSRVINLRTDVWIGNRDVIEVANHSTALLAHDVARVRLRLA